MHIFQEKQKSFLVQITVGLCLVNLDQQTLALCSQWRCADGDAGEGCSK